MSFGTYINPALAKFHAARESSVKKTENQPVDQTAPIVSGAAVAAPQSKFESITGKFWDKYNVFERKQNNDLDGIVVRLVKTVATAVLKTVALVAAGSVDLVRKIKSLRTSDEGLLSEKSQETIDSIFAKFAFLGPKLDTGARFAEQVVSGFVPRMTRLSNSPFKDLHDKTGREIQHMKKFNEEQGQALASRMAQATDDEEGFKYVAEFVREIAVSKELDLALYNDCYSTNDVREMLLGGFNVVDAGNRSRVLSKVPGILDVAFEKSSNMVQKAALERVAQTRSEIAEDAETQSEQNASDAVTRFERRSPVAEALNPAVSSRRASVASLFVEEEEFRSPISEALVVPVEDQEELARPGIEAEELAHLTDQIDAFFALERKDILDKEFDERGDIVKESQTELFTTVGALQSIVARQRIAERFDFSSDVQKLVSDVSTLDDSNKNLKSDIAKFKQEFEQRVKSSKSVFAQQLDHTYEMVRSRVLNDGAAITSIINPTTDLASKYKKLRDLIDGQKLMLNDLNNVVEGIKKSPRYKDANSKQKELISAADKKIKKMNQSVQKRATELEDATYSLQERFKMKLPSFSKSKAASDASAPVATSVEEPAPVVTVDIDALFQFDAQETSEETFVASASVAPADGTLRAEDFDELFASMDADAAPAPVATPVEEPATEKEPDLLAEIDAVVESLNGSTTSDDQPKGPFHRLSGYSLRDFLWSGGN